MVDEGSYIILKRYIFLSSEPSWMVQKKNGWSMEVESQCYCYTQMAKALPLIEMGLISQGITLRYPTLS